MKIINTFFCVSLLACTVALCLFTSCNKQESNELIVIEDELITTARITTEGEILPIPPFGSINRYTSLPSTSSSDYYCPQFDYCNGPLGTCDFFSMFNSDEGVRIKVQMPEGGRLMKVTLEEENDYDWAALEEMLAEHYEGEELAYHMDYCQNYYKVTTPEEVSEEYVEGLLSLANLRGNSITIMPGEYAITHDEETPFGSFEMEISIE